MSFLGSWSRRILETALDVSKGNVKVQLLLLQLLEAVVGGLKTALPPVRSNPASYVLMSVGLALFAFAEGLVVHAGNLAVLAGAEEEAGKADFDNTIVFIARRLIIVDWISFAAEVSWALLTIHTVVKRRPTVCKKLTFTAAGVVVSLVYAGLCYGFIMLMTLREDPVPISSAISGVEFDEDDKRDIRLGAARVLSWAVVGVVGSLVALGVVYPFASFGGALVFVLMMLVGGVGHLAKGTDGDALAITLLPLIGTLSNHISSFVIYMNIQIEADRSSPKNP